MKRSEMLKKLDAYINDLIDNQEPFEALPTLQFLEDQGMEYVVRYLHKDSVVGWEPEEDPKPLLITERIQKQIAEHMGWTDLQARRWYHQMNPLLGGLSPNDMVCQGRQDKLIKWINNQLDENKHSPHMQDQLNALSSMTIVEPDQFSSRNENIAVNFMNENKELMQDLAKQEELYKLPKKKARKKKS